MKGKSELWWISVGGNVAEPARLTYVEKVRTVFTIGCPDGIEAGDKGIILLQKIEKSEIPMTDEQAAKAKKAWERKVQREIKKGNYHGYRRFE